MPHCVISGHQCMYLPMYTLITLIYLSLAGFLQIRSRLQGEPRMNGSLANRASLFEWNSQFMFKPHWVCCCCNPGLAGGGKRRRWSRRLVKRFAHCSCCCMLCCCMLCCATIVLSYSADLGQRLAVRRARRPVRTEVGYSLIRTYTWFVEFIVTIAKISISSCHHTIEGQRTKSIGCHNTFNVHLWHHIPISFGEKDYRISYLASGSLVQLYIALERSACTAGCLVAVIFSESFASRSSLSGRLPKLVVSSLSNRIYPYQIHTTNKQQTNRQSTLTYTYLQST